MRYVIVGTLIGLSALAFQNCSEPKLEFDYADHASALGVKVKIVADPANIPEFQKDQDYTVEIELPEKGEIASYKVLVDGIENRNTRRNALGNIEFDFKTTAVKKYDIKAEVFTPNGTKFEDQAELIIKDDHPPVITITPLIDNDYTNINSKAQVFEFVAIDKGGGYIKNTSCTFSHVANGTVQHVTANCGYNPRTGEGKATNPKLVAGTNTLTIYAEDSFGNTAQEVLTFSIGKDSLPPSLKVTAHSTNTYYTKDSQKFDITATDFGVGLSAVSCTLKKSSVVVANSAVSNCYIIPGSATQTLALSSLSAGNHVLTVVAQDKESPANTTTVEVTIPMISDTTAPTITLSPSASNTKLKGFQQQVGFQVKDDQSGIDGKTLQCKVKESIVPCSIDAKGIGEIKFTPTEAGTHTVLVSVKDNYGNLGSKSIDLAIIADTTAPKITITENSTNPSIPLIGNSLKFDFIVTKDTQLSPITSVICYDSSNKAINCNLSEDKKTGSFTVTVGTPGTHTVKVVATDGAGNITTQTHTTVVKQLVSKQLAFQNQDFKKLDVLIVIDNSGSMSEEQRNMANRINSFVSKLEGIDWRAAVVTTDVATSTTQGRFVKIKASGKYFVEHNEEDAQEKIGTTVQGVGVYGSASEQGIAASYYALLNRGTSENAGFFRDDAGLSIVLISDEDETGNASVNSGENLVNYIKQLWPKKPHKFHSIVANSASCAGSRGNKYMALSTLTGGEIGCVAAADYGPILEKIGVSSSELTGSLSLACAPYNKAITMTKNSSAFSPAHTINGSQVTFTTPLGDGSYTLSYQCVQ